MKNIDEYTIHEVTTMTMGGSHRRFNQQVKALSGAGIPFRVGFSVNIGSKFKHVEIPLEFVDGAKKLGLRVSR